MSSRKNTLLWRLEGPDLPGPSYLFGTMHVRDRRAFQWLPAVQECILHCDAFATEFDLSEMSGPVHSAGLSLPARQSLDRLIPPKRYARLRSTLLKAVNLDIDHLRDKLPLLIANFIDERMLARDMPHALDEMLYMFARRHDKRLLGIETFAEQLQVLQRISIEEQVHALLEAGRHIARHRRHLLHMTRLYEQADIQGLYRSARRGAQGMRKLMLFDRNAIMAERIGVMIREQTTFCAVGAAHLAGEKGVLRLLKVEQGAKVTGM